MGDTSENPLDRHYHSLKCDLKPLDKVSDEFKVSAGFALWEAFDFRLLKDIKKSYTAIHTS